MTDQFIHLNVHSEYSFSDSTIRISRLIQKCSDLGQGAIALTDNTNIFGAVRFFKQAKKHNIFPILGADIRCSLTTTRVVALTLLCKNQAGYLNLCTLLTSAFSHESNELYGLVTLENLTNNRENLICINNDLSTKSLKSNEHHKQLLSIFKEDYFLAFSPINNTLQTIHHQNLYEVSNNLSIPLIATNNVKFLNKEDYPSHGVRVCIQKSLQYNNYLKNPLYHSDQYLKSTEEMKEIYTHFPEALSNAISVAKLCNLSITEEKNAQIPYLSDSPESIDPEKKLKDMANHALSTYLKKYNTLDKAEYQKRLDYELSIINNFGFAGYFLVVHEFIHWSKQNGIMVGPGRGSGVSSLVAFAIGITMLDPISNQLLFERFLNPDRKSLPDFDVDFCVKNRDKVINHLFDRYGIDSTAQIITFGTLAAKAALRDVGRALGYPYNLVDRITKMVPNELEITLEEAKNTSSDFNEAVSHTTEGKQLYKYAVKLEGLIRNISRHAGGVVVAPKKMTHYTALYYDRKVPHAVTHFDKKDLEFKGLIKFDILGISMLSTIDHTLKLIYKRTAKKINIETIDLGDSNVYQLLRKGLTLGVFQLEGVNMSYYLIKLAPNKFEDLIALNALHRPGPLKSGMVDDYIDRKNGHKSITYLHPSLEQYFGSTYGVIVYQEQVLRLAKDLASLSQGESEQFRVAITKKDEALLNQLKKKFLENITKKINSKSKALKIYQDIEKFTGYSFNRSHSAAYALLSYQTAWLKTHYRIEFISSYLTIEMESIDKIAKIIRNPEIADIQFLPPSINHSDFEFNIISQNKVRYGLGAVKGVGSAACHEIVEQRQKEGDYQSFTDFINRVNLTTVNKRAIESLIYAGAFDEFGYIRKMLIENLQEYLRKGARNQEDKILGQQSLLQPQTNIDLDSNLKAGREFDVDTLAKEENSVYGYYFSIHPTTKYEKITALLNINKFSSDHGVVEVTNDKYYLGLIYDLFSFSTFRGEKYKVKIEDDSCNLEATATRDIFGDHHPNELLNRPLLFLFHNDSYSSKQQYLISKIYTLQKYLHRFNSIECHIDPNDELFDKKIANLKYLVKSHSKGPTKILLKIDTPSNRYTFEINKSVELNIDLLDQFSKLNPRLCK